MVIRSWLIALYYRLTTRTVRSRPRRRRTFYSAVPAMVETMEPRIALTAFQGIGLQDQFNDFGSGSLPPDTMGAVGPNHFVEIINSSVAIYTKAGTRLSHVPLTTFFTDVGEGITPANGTFDPRVLYDQASGHWFATAMERGTVSGKDNDVILAVSDTSDPTGDWDRFRIDVGIATGANAFFTDYSTLGVDENGVYFGMTMFQDTGNDGTTNASFAKIAMTPKASLISGTPSLGTVTQVSNITDMYSSPQPATNFDDIAATDPFYFVSSSTTVFGNVNYRKVTWSGSTPTLSSTSVVTTSAYANPINALASGSTTNVNVGDDRLQMALVRDGHLWTTRQVGVNSSGTNTSANRTAVEWIDLNVTGASPTLAQSGRIFDNAASDPRFYYYPSLAVTGQGHMRIGFSGSKSTEFVGAYSSGRLASDTVGTTTAPVLIKAGEASYTRLDSSGRNRWGDYSYTSVDPNDDMTVWTIQEYAESNGTNVWGTWISSIAAPTPTLNDPSASASAGASNVTLNLTGTNFFDPGAGFPNHLGVQFTGGATNGITIDSVTFNSATSATVVFDIAAGASVGLRNIVLTNPDGQTVTVVGGFTVNDAAGFTIVESGGSTSVGESGTTDTFTVVLNAQPNSNVVLTVVSGDTGEATVGPATLTFTPANWNTPQTVTVTGVNDDLVDGSQTTTVTVAVDDANSDDNFDPVANQTVSVSTSDNDAAGFTIVESGGSTSVSESGTTDTFTVVLNAQPNSNVVLTVVSGDTGEATVGPATLTFTPANWSTPQTVTVTGVNDDLVDGSQTTTVTLAVDDAASDDNFDPVANQTVSVSTSDNDSTANSVPVLAETSAITYTENAAAMTINTAITVSDPDHTALASATVTLTTFVAGQDTLAFTNDGSTMDNIAVAGNTNGVLTLTSAGATATLAQWQAALRAVTYLNSSDNPTTTQRSVMFVINDGLADSNTLTSTINVTAVNDVPVANASSVTTNEDTAKTFASSAFLFTDVEGNSLVSITVSGLALAVGDTLTVDQGSGAVAVTNGMTITAAQIATLIYTPATNANGAARSTFSFKVNDADVGTVAGAMTVHVTAIDDDPEVGAFDTTVTYTANGVAVMLDMNATVTDVDTPRFNGGVLTVSLTANAEANDLLEIRQVTRLIGVSGSNVTYRGTIIGTRDGGVGTEDLVITFNANATISAVQTVLRNVTYRSVSATPSTAPRTVQITLTDGAGGISNLPTKTINVGAAPGAAPLAATLPATSVAVDPPSVTTVRPSSVNDSEFRLTFANTSTAGTSSIGNDQNADDLLLFVNAEESERLKKRRRNL